MREIKFRAWDSNANEMYQDVGTLPMSADHYSRIAGDGLAYRHDNPKIELMQYTGLKDRNGVEIYEGDFGTGIDRNGNPFSGVVFWKDGGFRIKTHDSKHGEPLFFFKEVIGNIYENPELLTKETI